MDKQVQIEVRVAWWGGVHSEAKAEGWHADFEGALRQTIRTALAAGVPVPSHILALLEGTPTEAQVDALAKSPAPANP